MPAGDHLALGQGMLLEHGLHGLQVERRIQVHDRQIFVIELAMLVGTVAVVD